MRSDMVGGSFVYLRKRFVTKLCCEIAAASVARCAASSLPESRSRFTTPRFASAHAEPECASARAAPSRNDCAGHRDLIR